MVLERVNDKNNVRVNENVELFERKTKEMTRRSLRIIFVCKNNNNITFALYRHLILRIIKYFFVSLTVMVVDTSILPAII